MDANEYFNKVRLSRGLIQLVMCNLIKESTGKNGLGTYFRGEKQIDEICPTKYTVCQEEIFIQIWSRILDHRDW